MKPLRPGLIPGQGAEADGIWMRRGMVTGTRTISLNFKPVGSV